MKKMADDYHASEFHLFRMFDKNILFNVETMLFYEVSPVVYDIADLLSDPGHPDPVTSLKTRYPEAEIKEAVVYLMQEGFLREGRAVPAKNRPRLIKRSGIRHLELMVTHACNMRCRYCYGSLSADGWQEAPHLYGANDSGMSLETAIKGVDYLFEASGRLTDLSVIFFGGEPLLELPLMKKVAAHVREKEAETGKKADLSLSTNALLLRDKRVIDFLMKQKVGCQISIDGPKETHDQSRCLPVGPFLRDCDGDGILEADTNGDGRWEGDPEVRDYNGNGSRELPEGTSFTGDFQFTCFYIPDDVAIATTGPLTIAASREAAVFGAMRLASGVQISSSAMIDLRTSAWLSEDGSEIRFATALAGAIDETQNYYPKEESVPPIEFTSV